MPNPRIQQSEPSSRFDHSMPFWSMVPDGPLGAMLKGMEIWNGTCSKAITSLNAEWLGLLQRRVQEDFALPQRLASCQCTEEVVRVYSEFWQKATDDYRKEFADLSRLSSIMMSESMAALQQVSSGEDKGPSQH
jgi:Phasin protein